MVQHVFWSPVSASEIRMLDSNGTTTVWTKSGSVWQVGSVQQPGSNTTSSYTYNAAGLVTRILAPVPAGISCASPDTNPGCRSLALAYGTVAGATRLVSVSLVAYDPAVSVMRSVEVARYDYDASGRLADEYDPRITPALKTAYGYDGNGRLASLTPPGQAAWSLGYDDKGRLMTVSRPDPANQATATTILVYDVPARSAVPIDLSATAAAAWDQTADLPTTGTAIFPPHHPPAATTPGAVPATDWPYAQIHYLDVNGRETNTAAYGAGAWQIDTSQYDSNGNAIWQLTAGNRAQALNPTEVTDSYGPIHPVVLADGSTVHARTHTATSYDETAPDDGTTYALPTTTVTAARTSDGVDHDPITTHTGYAAITAGDPTGWTLRKPTSTTTQMGPAPSPADLVKVTRYNTAGQVAETRLPGDAGGGHAGSTVTGYYTATGTGPCVNAALAGLPCTTGPAAQPNTGNPLPVTNYRYDMDSNLTTKTEAAGSTVRTTTTSYDAGERKTGQNITVTPAAAGGTALPAVSYGYDPATGQPTTVSTGSGGAMTTVTTGYDTLGRVTSYTDATGVTTTTGYDIDGRRVSRNDGKGTVSYSYDTSTEHRGMVTSENVGVSPAPGTFAAAYDADGKPAVLTYPNGLTAATTYDNTGDATKLAYTKDGATWMTFTQGGDAQGRTVRQTSPQSQQTFRYDPAGRLTQTQDTVTTNGITACTTRQYTLDPDSNRTALRSYPAAADRGCTTATPASMHTSSFDQADRITDTGYGYDSLGRTTTVPAADAAGIGARAGLAGDLTVGYYANDIVASQAQGGSTLTFGLDPLQNRIAASTDTTTGAIRTRHYGDDGDSPTWTETGSTWQRYLPGPNGDLAATIDQTGTVTLQLANLHGDIVATVADDPSATAPTSYSESTEYGQPSDPAAAGEYGWLGAKQRSADTLGGLTLMGVRLYNPTTGRFLQVDPIPGGTDNPYVYVTNPTDQYDLNGQWGWNWKKAWRRATKWASGLGVGFSVCAGYIVGGCVGASFSRDGFSASYNWSGHNRAFYGASASANLTYQSHRTSGTNYCFSASVASVCRDSRHHRTYGMSYGWGISLGSSFSRGRSWRWWR